MAEEDKKGLLRKFAQKFSAKVYTSESGTAMVRITKEDVSRFGIPRDAELVGRILNNAELKELFNTNVPYEGRYLLVQIFGEGPEVVIKKEIPLKR